MTTRTAHPLRQLPRKILGCVRLAAEWTGVDWFGLLLGVEPFQLKPDPWMESERLREEVGAFSTLDAVDLALRVCEDLQERESERSSKIEGKALHLIGSVGLPSGIVLGAFGFLLQSGMKLPAQLYTALFALFSLSAISLLWAVFLGLRVVVVAGPPSSSPDSLDVLNLATQEIVTWKKDRTADLLVSYSMNVKRTNRKATYLIGAQLWFRNAVALLLLFAVVVGVTMPLLMATS